jgi:DNA-binding MarR family transcriptional regulator
MYIVIMTATLSSRPADAKALYAVIVEVRRLFHRLAADTDRLHADLRITAAERAVLEALADGGRSTVPDLARRKGVTRQHVQALANQLARAGLVEPLPNPAHRRSPLLELTAAGRRAFGAMRAREDRLLAAVAGRIAAPPLDGVARTLREIGDGVSALVARAPRSRHR